MRPHRSNLFQRLSGIVLSLLLAACAPGKNSSWQSISQSQAAEIMKNEKNIIILDVRTEEEFAEEHIPNAVNLPNESITDTPPALLPDKNQTILIYCRTGIRARQAAQKLADLGYTGVKEFGGISTWDGPTESFYDRILPVLMLDAHSASENDGITLEVSGYCEGELEITLQNQSGSAFAYGEAFDLSVKENDAWQRLAWPDGKVWTAIAYELADGEQITLKKDIRDLEPLSSGIYRFSMNGYDAQFSLVMSE